MGERLTTEMEAEIRGAVAREEFFGWTARHWLGPMLQEIDALRGEVEASKAQLHEVAVSTHGAMEQVKRERDALALKWSEELPTEPGAYWWRVGVRSRKQILEFNGVTVQEAGNRGTFYPCELGGEWAGPIASPEEASDANR